MGIVVSAVTSAALVALFAVTLRYQFYSHAQFLRRRTPLGLLRQYRLFAPAPVRTDFHLVVRDYDCNGVPRPCREIPMTPLRQWRQALWYPEKRRWLPLRPLLVELTAVGATLEDCPVAIELTTPYLVLLGVVSAEPADPDVRARQFLIVECFGHEPEEAPAVIFCSAVHRLEHTATAAR